MGIKPQKATFIFNKVLSISKKGQKNFFLRYLKNSKNPQNSKIFNCQGYHDHSKKKISKICKNGANHPF